MFPLFGATSYTVSKSERPALESLFTQSKIGIKQIYADRLPVEWVENGDTVTLKINPNSDDAHAGTEEFVANVLGFLSFMQGPSSLFAESNLNNAAVQSAMTDPKPAADTMGTDIPIYLDK